MYWLINLLTCGSPSLCTVSSCSSSISTASTYSSLMAWRRASLVSTWKTGENLSNQYKNNLDPKHLLRIVIKNKISSFQEKPLAWLFYLSPFIAEISFSPLCEFPWMIPFTFFRRKQMASSPRDFATFFRLNRDSRVFVLIRVTWRWKIERKCTQATNATTNMP